MKHVLFISVPSTGIDLLERRKAQQSAPIFPPLGVVYLFSAVKRELGDRVQCSHLDFNIYREEYASFTSIGSYDCFIRKKIEQSPKNPPDYVCVSVNFSVAHSFFSLVVKNIRDIYPECTIIAGGTHISSLGKRIFTLFPDLDYVICGEGDEVLPQLLRQCIAGSVDIAIPGVHTLTSTCRDDRETTSFAIPVEKFNLDFSQYDTCLDMK